MDDFKSFILTMISNQDKNRTLSKYSQSKQDKRSSGEPLNPGAIVLVFHSSLPF